MPSQITIERWLGADTQPPADPTDLLAIPFEPFRDEWIAEPIFSHFERVAARHRDKIAVDDGKLRFTFEEIRQAAARLAHTVERTAPAGRPVGLALANNARFPIAALACLAAGRPYVPIDLSYPEAHKARVVAEAGLAAAIIDGTAVQPLNLPDEIPLIDVAASCSGIEETSVRVAPSAGPAIILFTSGSTGQPKGICNDQAAIVQRVAQATNTCHLNADDRFVLFSSPGTIAGVREGFSALLNGATLYVADPLRLGITGLLQVVADAKPTVGYAVPALWRSILMAPAAKTAFSRLRILRTGGDTPLESDLALCRETLPASCKIVVSFSSTEVPIVFQWFVPPDWKPDSPRLPIGYVREGVSFILKSADQVEGPEGRSGELVVRSRYLALGLWQNGRLQQGPFSTDPDDRLFRVYHTGDLVRLRDDGLAEMVGRNDRQIKIRGLRVDIGQIEAVLRRCDGVADAAVIPRRSGEEVHALVAFVARRGDAGPALADELKRAFAENLPGYMRPAHIRLVDEIPRLPSFKPNMKALEALERQGEDKPETQSPAAQPGDGVNLAVVAETAESHRIRQIVEEAWTALLDRASLVADLPWDDAGGDSLKALELWFRIERAVGRTLPLDSLQPHTTPRGLVTIIEQLLAADTHDAGAGDLDRPTIFLLPGIVGDEPLLVAFRARLAAYVRFEMIEYPDWRQLMEGGVKFETIVASAVEQIRKIALARHGPCFLAGYSYGGFVAHEAAHRLLKMGQPVALLAVVDSRPGALGRRNPMGRVRELLSNPGTMPLELERRVITLCIRLGWFGLLRAVAERIVSRPFRMAFAFHYHLLAMLRVQALRQWRPTPLPVSTILFTSGDQLEEQGPDLGWRGLCEPLRIAHIGGTHESMLAPPFVDRICALLLNVLGFEGARVGRVGVPLHTGPAGPLS